MYGKNPTDIGATNAISNSRYIGKICAKHPELNGERRKIGYSCIGCAREKKKRWKEKPETKVKTAEYRNRLRELTKVGKLIAEQAEVKVRHRAAAIASARKQDVSKWQEFYNEALNQITTEARASQGQSDS